MNIHAPGGIRTRDSSRQAATDLRPRTRGHRDRHSIPEQPSQSPVAIPIELWQSVCGSTNRLFPEKLLVMMMMIMMLCNFVWNVFTDSEDILTFALILKSTFFCKSRRQIKNLMCLPSSLYTEIIWAQQSLCASKHRNRNAPGTNTDSYCSCRRGETALCEVEILRKNCG